MNYATRPIKIVNSASTLIVDSAILQIDEISGLGQAFVQGISRIATLSNIPIDIGINIEMYMYPSSRLTIDSNTHVILR